MHGTIAVTLKTFERNFHFQIIVILKRLNTFEKVKMICHTHSSGVKLHIPGYLKNNSNNLRITKQRNSHLCRHHHLLSTVARSQPSKQATSIPPTASSPGQKRTFTGYPFLLPLDYLNRRHNCRVFTGISTLSDLWGNFNGSFRFESVLSHLRNRKRCGKYLRFSTIFQYNLF